MIDKFTGGNSLTRRKLNEIVDALNTLEKMKGDPFIQVKGIGFAKTLALNVDALRPRLRGAGGGTPVFKAFVKTTPGATTDVDCFLSIDATGTEITVTVKIYAGGGNLDTAEPLLEDGDDFLVYNDAGTWRNVTTFFKVDECP